MYVFFRLDPQYLDFKGQHLETCCLLTWYSSPRVEILSTIFPVRNEDPSETDWDDPHGYESKHMESLVNHKIVGK